MEETTGNLFSEEERKEFLLAYKQLLSGIENNISKNDIKKLKEVYRHSDKERSSSKDIYGLNPWLRNIHTACIVSNEIGLKRAAVLAVLLHQFVRNEDVSLENLDKDFGEDVRELVSGLIKIDELYKKNASIETENFSKLLISFVEDIRVILIMIADRLELIREEKSIRSEEYRLKIAAEASYLYAPLSHKLGLYKIKSELEDLALKIQDRQSYDYVAGKLNETKRSRDEYISEFIAPLKKKLTGMGFLFSIKGRTKSISSILHKLKKQKIEFESIYDLFAIRIILDTPLEKERAECWQVYSVVTDMYPPNPKRLKDWLSIPKSNGYESLHITVMGPKGRWVEVQIRTKRMDEIAEKGLAAHWKYKGIKGESGLDEWLTSVREVLENKNEAPKDIIEDFKMDLYDEEIFVFTPKGDLMKLPKNSTVLDFAFAVHSNVGSKCISAKINGKNVTIKHRLQNGDQVNILTSPNQSPKPDWLTFVVTSKARVKIKQSLKEQAAKQAEFAKEDLKRKFKNRKIEEDEPTLSKLIKKMGYKNITDFYADIATEKLDINDVIDRYLEFEKKNENIEHSDRSAESFSPNRIEKKDENDGLVIDQNLTDIEYKLAKCCNPIYGDEIFGFVSSQGIKIHRMNCPNAQELFARYGYRIVKARWAGKSASNKYIVTLKVIGKDDIGIITNITSVISKETSGVLRSINIDSKDGIFQGTVSVTVNDTTTVNTLIKKIRAINGVSSVSRY